MENMLNNKLKYWMLFGAVLILTVNIMPSDKDLIKDLRGKWKFNIGDNMKWLQMGFNDDNWDDVYVPAPWENEGYHGYDGFAWYRKKVYISSRYMSRRIEFDLGRIDDADEVYFNEKLIGKTGSFPPEYVSAYSNYRNYVIPNTVIRWDDWNLISVRVYDSEQYGGMIDGNFCIYATKNVIFPLMSLESEWKFKTGDNSEWKNENYDDSKWGSIMVPGKWEAFGYPLYDGYAWYRKKFVPLKTLEGKELVLMLGKIDDYDEVYLNGKRIGGTGLINSGKLRNNDPAYSQFRGYFVPDGLLKYNAENVIAVRVFDGWRDGGIYEGPIGFTTQQNYVQFWRQEKKNSKSFFEKLFNGD